MLTLVAVSAKINTTIPIEIIGIFFVTKSNNSHVEKSES